MRGFDAGGAQAERERLRQRGSAGDAAAAQQAAVPVAPANVDDREAALAYLGITHSHPDWLVARWLDRYGFEATERWVQFNNETPSLTLRVNTLRATRDAAAATLAADDVDTEPTRFAPDGLAVRRGNPLRRPADGLAFVQDEASQLVPLVVAASPASACSTSAHRQAARRSRWPRT